MPRSCMVCAHDEHHAINVELVHRVPYRNIAERFGVSKAALSRHSQDHIPELLLNAYDGRRMFPYSRGIGAPGECPGEGGKL
jgi:hypothetical protein